MPMVGLGTSRLLEEEVLNAILAGARHLDCAPLYGNERMVGSAIKRSGIDREELFVTTKIWNDWHSRVEESVNMSLEELGLDYVDLVLIHWPLSWAPGMPFCSSGTEAGRDVWPQLASLVESGKVRSLGVSNFDQTQLKPLLGLDPPCCVNQIECHPFFQNRKLVEFCRQHRIQVVAWGPLAKGSVSSRSSALSTVAKNRGCSEAQIAIRWNLDRGVAVVPRSSRHVRENLERVDPLDDDETRLVDACDTSQRRFPDLVGVWPATARTPAKLFGKLLSFFSRIIFLIFPKVELVQLSKQAADRREVRAAQRRA